MSRNLRSTTPDKLQRPPSNRCSKDEKSPSIPKKSPKAVQKKKSIGKKKNELYPDLDEIDDAQCIGSSASEEVEENVDFNADNTPIRGNSKEKSPDVDLRKRTHKDDSYDHNKSEIVLIEDKFEKFDTKEKKKMSYWWLVIFIVIFIIGVVLFAGKGEYIYPQNTNKVITNYGVFKSHFDKIKVKYPSQTQRFWQIIHASIKHVLTETASTYPAVILITVPKGHSETGTCISNEIVKIFNKVFNYSISAYVNSEHLKLSYPDKAKVDLDDHFILYLNGTYGKGVVLDYVNLLPAQCGLLLHGYCDGDNAPFKDVVILLTLHTDYEFQELYDSKVEDILTQMWEHDLGIDEMPALRSRIANNIAILSPESNFVCQ